MKNQHLILQLREVENVDALKSLELLRSAMDDVLSLLAVNVVGTCGHQFLPHGATMLYLLSESHCSCHTFWEEREAYIDLFCCSDFDADLAVREFVAAFRSGSFDSRVLIRASTREIRFS